MYDDRDDFSRRLAEQLRIAESQRKARQSEKGSAASETARARTYAHPAQALRARLGHDRFPLLGDER